jgi:hypothetical protein
MKRQLTVAALALLCLGTPGAAKDKIAAFITERFTDFGPCVSVTHVRNWGTEGSFVATCSSGMSYLVMPNVVHMPVWPCLAGICDEPAPGSVYQGPIPAQPKLPTIIRGPS